MSQSKRNNIIFYSILTLVVILSIGGTTFAILSHNKNVDNNKVTNNPQKEEEITPFLTFKSVSESKTIDVFKNYPVNPIKINHEKNNKITISGLKNKEVQNKINKKLSVLKDEKTQSGESVCNAHFNVSNVLSISCNDEKSINVNLVTGDDIELEDVFNKDSDIYSILVKSNYNHICSWEVCEPSEETDAEWISTVENQTVENLQEIKNKNYNITLTDATLIIEYDDNDSDGESATFINYYNFPNDITIYDRYLDESIYETEVTEYCEANSCYELKYNTIDTYINYEYLNDKVYLTYEIRNYSDQDSLYSDEKKEKYKIDLNKVSEILKKEIIKNENIDIKGNNYIEYDCSIMIYYHTPNDFQVEYAIIKKELTKDNFIKYRLGYNEAKTISEKIINKVHMLLDKNNKITYMSNNPTRDLSDFENKLYDYIMNDIKTNEYGNFSGYNACEFSEDDDCEEKKDYHNLIKEASYAIDNINNRLLMYEFKPGIGMAESYVKVYIPLDVFKEKPIEDNNNDNTENSSSDEE